MSAAIVHHLPTISEAAREIASRRLSPLELTGLCLERIEAANGSLSCFVTVTSELALKQAAAAERTQMRGESSSPMLGIPYGLKDIFETAGIATTGQSRYLADFLPAEDCEVQKRLATAGAVLLGKTATWEFAHGGPSWDLLFPPARNPWNPDCDPSGSSSGSAAAVAAGLCSAAMGSDTGGSIRGPAAACGVVGLKPTFGLVSRRGVLPNSTTYDHCGPLTRTVEDAAIMLDAIAGHDPLDSFSVDRPAVRHHREMTARPLDNLRGITIGVPWQWIEEEVGTTPVLRGAFDAALSVLGEAGAEIRPVMPPPATAYEDTKKVIAACELFAFYGPGIRAAPELFGRNFRYRVMPGAVTSAEDYINAHKLDLYLKSRTDALFDAVDFIVTPAQEPAGRLESGTPESLFTSVGYLTAFSLTGHPALVLPMGHTDTYLPLGLQLVGRKFGEIDLLRFAHFYERATLWFERMRAASA